MTLQQIITECAAITKSKGFDVSQHATQTALIATEVAEALESIALSGHDSPELEEYVASLKYTSEVFEQYRKSGAYHADLSEIIDPENHTEELADICIRVFSYIGGNDQTEKFLQVMQQKIEKNRNRPVRHGKGF